MGIEPATSRSEDDRLIHSTISVSSRFENTHSTLPHEPCGMAASSASAEQRGGANNAKAPLAKVLLQHGLAQQQLAVENLAALIDVATD